MARPSAFAVFKFRNSSNLVGCSTGRSAGFVNDWRAHQRTVDQLVHHPNVYGDTSGVRRFDYIVQAVKRAGPHKVIFGSDGPWLHPGVEIEKIRLLGLPPREEALVLGGNASRLLARVRVRLAVKGFNANSRSIPCELALPMLP
jgi:amidohydrolase family protein